MRKILLLAIKLYQKTLSYDHGYLGRIFPNVRYCKFTPTCSMYTYQAVEKYGSIKGIGLGIKRISRCNKHTPMGTFDPVE